MLDGWDADCLQILESDVLFVTKSKTVLDLGRQTVLGLVVVV